MAISKITTSGVATDTLTAADLAPNSVDSSELVDGSVDLSHMSANSVDSDQYVDASIDLAHMSANSVDSDQYVDASIDLAHMSVNSIDSDQYVDTSIDTAHIGDDQVTGAKIENNPTIAGNLTVSGDIVPSTALSHRNMIINGAMQVWQRRTSDEAGLGAMTGTVGYRLADRWVWTMDGNPRVNLSKETVDLPAGFSNAYKTNCTTTSSGGSGTHRAYFEQRIEGQNLDRIQKGYATAKPVTLSFWVKTVITGVTDPVFRVNLQDHENTRIIGGSYTYDTSEGGWQQMSVTFAGDTSTSDKITSDNANRMSIEWWLYDAGYYSSGAIPTSWEAQADADRNSNSTGNVMGNTSNYWMITGVQLEIGSNATPYEHRSFGDELARCQRYYEKSYDYGVAPGTTTDVGFTLTGGMSGTNTSSYISGFVTFRETKRNISTITLYDTQGASGKVSVTQRGISTSHNQTADAVYVSERGFAVDRASGSTGSLLEIHYTALAEL